MNRQLLFRKWLALAVYGLLHLPLFLDAQKLTGTDRIDSLRQAIEKLTGTQKADGLNDLAFELFSFDSDQTFMLATEAFQLSQKLNYDKGMAQSSIYMGLHMRSSGDQPAALNYLRAGLQYARQSGAKDVNGYATLQMGSFFMSQGFSDSAGVYYQQAFTILRDSTHAVILSILYKNWAHYFGVQGDHQKKAEYLFRAMRIREDEQ